MFHSNLPVIPYYPPRYSDTLGTGTLQHVYNYEVCRTTDSRKSDCNFGGAGSQNVLIMDPSSTGTMQRMQSEKSILDEPDSPLEDKEYNDNLTFYLVLALAVVSFLFITCLVVIISVKIYRWRQSRIMCHSNLPVIPYYPPRYSDTLGTGTLQHVYNYEVCRTTDSRKSDCKFSGAGSQNVLIMDPSSTGTMQRIQSEKSILDEPDSPLEDKEYNDNLTFYLVLALAVVSFLFITCLVVIISVKIYRWRQSRIMCHSNLPVIPYYPPRYSDTLGTGTLQHVYNYEVCRTTDSRKSDCKFGGAGSQNVLIMDPSSTGTMQRIQSEKSILDEPDSPLEDKEYNDNLTFYLVLALAVVSFLFITCLVVIISVKIYRWRQSRIMFHSNLPVIPYYPPRYSDTLGTGTLQHVYNYEVCRTTDSRKSDCKFGGAGGQNVLIMDPSSTGTMQRIQSEKSILDEPDSPLEDKEYNDNLTFYLVLALAVVSFLFITCLVVIISVKIYRWRQSRIMCHSNLPVIPYYPPRYSDTLGTGTLQHVYNYEVCRTTDSRKSDCKSGGAGSQNVLIMDPSSTGTMQRIQSEKSILDEPDSPLEDKEYNDNLTFYLVLALAVVSFLFITCLVVIISVKIYRWRQSRIMCHSNLPVIPYYPPRYSDTLGTGTLQHVYNYEVCRTTDSRKSDCKFGGAGSQNVLIMDPSSTGTMQRIQSEKSILDEPDSPLEDKEYNDNLTFYLVLALAVVSFLFITCLVVIISVKIYRWRQSRIMCHSNLPVIPYYPPRYSDTLGTGTLQHVYNYEVCRTTDSRKSDCKFSGAGSQNVLIMDPSSTGTMQRMQSEKSILDEPDSPLEDKEYNDNLTFYLVLALAVVSFLFITCLVVIISVKIYRWRQSRIMCHSNLPVIPYYPPRYSDTLGTGTLQHVYNYEVCRTTDSRKSDCKFGGAGSQNVLIMDPSSTGTMQRIQSEKSILDEPDSPLEDKEYNDNLTFYLVLALAVVSFLFITCLVVIISVKIYRWRQSRIMCHSNLPVIPYYPPRYSDTLGTGTLQHVYNYEVCRTTDSRKSDCKFGGAGSQNVLIMDPSSTGTMQRIQSEKSILDEPDSPLEDKEYNDNLTFYLVLALAVVSFLFITCLVVIISVKIYRWRQSRIMCHSNLPVIPYYPPRYSDTLGTGTLQHVYNYAVCRTTDSRKSDCKFGGAGSQNVLIMDPSSTGTMQRIQSEKSILDEPDSPLEDKEYNDNLTFYLVLALAVVSFLFITCLVVIISVKIYRWRREQVFYKSGGNLPVIPYYPPLYADVGGTGTLKQALSYEVYGTTDSRMSDMKCSRPFSQSTLTVDHSATRTVPRQVPESENMLTEIEKSSVMERKREAAGEGKRHVVTGTVSNITVQHL
ncbi:hypothetical protein KUCAC02_004783, partial [Chaenocephalus aceratus]